MSKERQNVALRLLNMLVTPVAFLDQRRSSLKCSIHRTLRTTLQTSSGTISDPILFFSSTVLTLVFPPASRELQTIQFPFG